MKVLSLAFETELTINEINLWLMQLDGYNKDFTLLIQRYSTFYPKDREDIKTILHIPVAFDRLFLSEQLKLYMLNKCSQALSNLTQKKLTVVFSEPLTIDHTEMYWSFDMKK